MSFPASSQGTVQSESHCPPKTRLSILSNHSTRHRFLYPSSTASFPPPFLSYLLFLIVRRGINPTILILLPRFPHFFCPICSFQSFSGARIQTFLLSCPTSSNLFLYFHRNPYFHITRILGIIPVNIFLYCSHTFFIFTVRQKFIVDPVPYIA